MSKDDPQDMKITPPKGRGMRSGLRSGGVPPSKRFNVSPDTAKPNRSNHLSGYFPFISKRTRNRPDQGGW